MGDPAGATGLGQERSRGPGRDPERCSRTDLEPATGVVEGFCHSAGPASVGRRGDLRRRPTAGRTGQNHRSATRAGFHHHPHPPDRPHHQRPHGPQGSGRPARQPPDPPGPGGHHLPSVSPGLAYLPSQRGHRQVAGRGGDGLAAGPHESGVVGRPTEGVSGHPRRTTSRVRNQQRRCSGHPGRPGEALTRCGPQGAGPRRRPRTGSHGDAGRPVRAGHGGHGVFPPEDGPRSRPPGGHHASGRPEASGR
jgi:hypothetical protein